MQDQDIENVNAFSVLQEQDSKRSNILFALAAVFSFALVAAIALEARSWVVLAIYMLVQIPVVITYAFKPKQVQGDMAGHMFIGSYFLFLVAGLAIGDTHVAASVYAFVFTIITFLGLPSNKAIWWAMAAIASVSVSLLVDLYRDQVPEDEIYGRLGLLFALLAQTILAYIIDVVAKTSTESLLSNQQNLEELNARYDIVLNSIGDGLVVVDEKGKIQFMNKAATDLLDIDRHDALGQAVSGTIFFKDESERILRNHEYPMQKVLNDLESINIDQSSKQKYWLVRGDNSTFPAALSLNPIRVLNNLTGGIMLFRDLTELQRIDQAKTEFVSLASHQLRTPLNVVSWYVEKLLKQKKGKLNEKQLDYLNEISENNGRMIGLVSDLLNVSRVDLGRIKLKHEEVELVKLAKALVKEVEPLAEKRSITLTQKLPASEIKFKDSDNNVLTVVIQNLLSNALKYTKARGSVDFTISKVKAGVMLSKKADLKSKSDGVIIKVKDDGIGIPKEQQEKIFGKLFRADNVSSLDVKGTGLGLYVTQSFVQGLGGEIWFESEEGKGTTFMVYLPNR